MGTITMETSRVDTPECVGEMFCEPSRHNAGAHGPPPPEELDAPRPTTIIDTDRVLTISLAPVVAQKPSIRMSSSDALNGKIIISSLEAEDFVR